MKIAYIRYSDPKPFSPEGKEGVGTNTYRAIFRAGGIVVMEDEEMILLGEQAVKQDNVQIAQRFGSDMFPAYRNVVPIRKRDILERTDFEIPVKE
ncbi:MAG: hypothetical protein KIY11_03225 [Thermoplasmata archaeon]|nr:hypothetical protein [Candidatus Sysuiplasma acidicola]